MHTTVGSYTQAALDSLQIIRRILELSEKHDRVVCARICQKWHRITAAILWRELHDLTPLLSLLEIKKQKVVLPSYTRRDRFCFYAERVEDLLVGDSQIRFSGDLITAVISNPTPYLLPNLTHIRWLCSLQLIYCLPLLSPKLEYISIQLPEQGPVSDDRLHDIINFFPALSTRCPRLLTIKFRCRHRDARIQQTLAKSLPKISSLESLVLADQLLSTEALDALSTCSSLREIRSSSIADFQRFRPDALAVIDYSPFGQPNGYPSLKVIDFHARSADIIKFFQLAAFPPSLRFINIQLGPSDFIDHSQALFESIGNCTLPIEELVVNAFKKHCTKGAEVKEPLPFTEIEPLLNCHHLRRLHLDFPSIIEMTNNDIHRLAHALPLLRVLYLSPKSSAPCSNQVSVTVDVLPDLLQSCPALECISLVINPTIPPARLIPTQVPRLKSLSVGLTVNKDDIPDIAIYLAELTGPDCEFDIWDIVEENDEDNRGTALGISFIDLMPHLRKLNSCYRTMCLDQEKQ